AARPVVRGEHEHELLVALLSLGERGLAPLSAEALVAVPLLRRHEVLVVIRLVGEQGFDAPAPGLALLEPRQLRPAALDLAPRHPRVDLDAVGLPDVLAVVGDEADVPAGEDLGLYPGHPAAGRL